MTERSESERAELEALADDAADDLLQEVRDQIDEGLDECLPSADIIGNVSRSINSALRLAAQDQKPVAWLQSSGTKTIVSQQRLDMDASRYGWTEKPLYLSPPPAAGWNESIEACKKVAEKWLESFMGGEAYVARSIVNAIEALRTTPAATKSADAGGE